MPRVQCIVFPARIGNGSSLLRLLPVVDLWRGVVRALNTVFQIFHTFLCFLFLRNRTNTTILVRHLCTKWRKIKIRPHGSESATEIRARGKMYYTKPSAAFREKGADPSFENTQKKFQLEFQNSCSRIPKRYPDSPASGL